MRRTTKLDKIKNFSLEVQIGLVVTSRVHLRHLGLTPLTA